MAYSVGHHEELNENNLLRLSKLVATTCHVGALSTWWQGWPSGVLLVAIAKVPRQAWLLALVSHDVVVAGKDFLISPLRAVPRPGDDATCIIHQLERFKVLGVNHCEFTNNTHCAIHLISRRCRAIEDVNVPPTYVYTPILEEADTNKDQMKTNCMVVRQSVAIRDRKRNLFIYIYIET